jgi:O-antigen ligase
MGKTMGIAKRLNWQNIFLFLFFIAFPFGQLVRLSFNIGGADVPLLPIDIIVGCAALYALVKNLQKIEIFKSLAGFLWVAVFSFIFSVFIFRSASLLYGLFYLLRLSAYFYFLLYVWNFAKSGLKNRKLLLDCLLGVSVLSAIFGWVQYFSFPDIKPFFVWGWDMHLFRLVGTFLDPTFLGLIIVFGLMLSITRFIDKRGWKNGLVTIFLLVSLAFTYSRASYLAFVAGILMVIYLNKKFKKLLFLVAGFIVIALLLPTAKNHSIELFRTFSAIARIENYQTTLQIFSKSPVFGIGYNNMCLAYQKYIGFQDFSSHSCSGSDSSLLMVLATTGVIGFMIFLNSVKRIADNVKHSSYLVLLSACFSALLIHSLFSNSLFYSWIMGYFVVLLAVVAKD